MQGTNAKELMRQIKDSVLGESEKELDKFCFYLLERAVWSRDAGGGHNITGNLINSLVALLYKKGQFVSAYFAYEYMNRPPVRVKMTAGKKYFVSPTWDGGTFAGKVGVETDEGWGYNDAIGLASSYKASPKNLFEIVVAAPVEYAPYIKFDTGLGGAYVDAKITIMSYLK